MASCFISHAWRNDGHQFAMNLGNALKEKNIGVWIDEKEIHPGDSIKEIIKKGIEHKSDVFLFVLSPEALKSKPCKYELNLALKQMVEKGKPIIPVFFKKCKMPKFLKNVCYADFRKPQDFDNTLKHLIEGIRRSDRLRKICRELNHLDPEKRIKASERLGELKNPLALGPLKNQFWGEFDGTVKHFIALAIGEIGGKKAIEILRQFMGEEDPHAKLGVIQGLNLLTKKNLISR